MSRFHLTKPISRFIAVSAWLSLALTPPLAAADLTWDNSDGSEAFIWDNQSNTNWTGSMWNNATPDNAIFGATGVGTITLQEAITAGNLTFNTTGYTITGNTLDFGIADPLITLAAGANVTINSNSASSTRDLDIEFLSGTSHLTLGGASMNFDSIDIDNGDLTIALGANVTLSGTSNSGAQDFGFRFGRNGEDGGLLTINGILNTTSIGTSSADDGTITVNAGADVNVSGGITLGWNSHGVLNMNGGTLDVGVIQHTDGGSANLNLNGGTLTATSVRNHSSGGDFNINFNGATLKAASDSLFLTTTAAKDLLAKHNIDDGGAIVDVNSFNVTSVQAFNTIGANTGGLTLRDSTGGGTMTYTGGNASGDTTVEGGTLNLSFSERGGAIASGTVSDFYDPNSNLILDGGNFTVTGRTAGSEVTRDMLLNPSNSASNSFLLQGSNTNLVAGMSISGTGIVAGTYIQHISSTNLVFLSNATTLNNTTESLTFGAIDDTTSQTIDEVELKQSATITVDKNGGSGTTLEIGTLTGNGSVRLTKTGDGTLTLSGNNSSTYDGGIYVNGGTLALTSDNALGSGGITETKGTRIGASGSDDTLDLSNNITLDTRFIRLWGDGVDDKGGIYSSSGNNTFTNSRVDLHNNTAAFGVATGSTLTFSGGNGFRQSGGTREVNKLGGGTLVMHNTTNNNFGGNINIQEGTLKLSGSSSNFLANSAGITISSGATFQADLTGAHTYGNVISGAGELIKSNTGTLTLTGNSTHTGNTTVNGGILDITGTLDSDTTVADGGGLSGEGSTSGDLTFTGNTTLITDASTDPAAFSSANLTTTGANVTVNINGAPAGSGNIIILDYSGSYSGTATTDFTVGTGLTLSGRGGAFSNNAINTRIELNAGFENKTWVGGVSGNWDIGATANWTGGSDDLFYDGDFVTFGNTGAGNVTLSGNNVAPASVTFSHDTGTYTIDSAAAETLTAAGGINLTGDGDVTIDSVIAGDTAIIHDGNGTLTLNAVNTFTGGTTVKSGATLATGNPNDGGANGFDQVLGSTAQDTVLTIENGGTLDVGNATLNGYKDASIKVQGAGVGGLGAIVKTTGATNFIAFNGELDFTGNTTIRNTVRMDFDGKLTNSTGSKVTLTKLGGAALYLNNKIVGAGFDWDLQEGAIFMEGANDSSENSTFTLQAGTYLQKNNTGAGTPITASGDFILNGGSLRSDGVAATTGNITYSGDISVTASSEIRGTQAIDITHLTGNLSGTSQLTLGLGTTRLEGNTSGFTGRVVLNHADSIVETAGVDHTIGSLQSTIALSTVQNNSTTAATLSLGADNTSDANFAGNIQDGAAGGVLNLVKTGTGTQTFSGNNTYTGTTVVSAGTLEIGDGNTTGSLAAASSITINTPGTLAFNRSDALTQGTDFSTAAITGTGGIEQKGAGTTTLTANNTYGGTTVVSAGTLIINGTHSGSPAAVTVNSGATLGGIGSVGGATTISGSHSAGANTSKGTVGSMTFGSDLTYASGSTITWDLIDNSTSTGFDTFAVGGGLDFGTVGGEAFTFNVNLSGDVNYYAPLWQDTDSKWKVWEVPSASVSGFVAGEFTINLDDTGVSGGPQSSGIFALSQESDGIYLNLITSVPEPSTYALMGLGLAAFGWVSRRRRKQTSLSTEKE